MRVRGIEPVRWILRTTAPPTISPSSAAASTAAALPATPPGAGWRVFLCERADLGSGTSSASTKLIHGGLRYLEFYEFRLVREALREREVLWGIAPHIIWPLRFVLPHHKRLRPAWLLRLGLFMYDHLGGRKRLPPTRTLDLRSDPSGALLKPEFTRGFAYSDCWVEDSRLVLLNALDAAERGATIAPRTACVSAERIGRAVDCHASRYGNRPAPNHPGKGAGQRGRSLGGRGGRIGDPRQRAGRTGSFGPGQPRRRAAAV